MATATTVPARDETALSWGGRFLSPEVETQFREYSRNQENRQAWLSYTSGIALSLVYIPSDRVVLGDSPAFWTVVYCRLAFVVYAAVALSLMGRVKPSARDWLLVLWTFFGSALTGLAIWTRPAEYFQGSLIALSFVFLLIYFVPPIAVVWQTTPAVLLSLVTGYLTFVKHTELNPLARRAILVTVVATNVIGTVVSWNLNRLRRREFAALRREMSLRTTMEATLAENKVLRGILPICAHCKNVRNDEGYWQRVEVYVRDHSEAEFTHGICPDCMQKHYGLAPKI